MNKKFNNLIYATELSKIFSFMTDGLTRKLIFYSDTNGFDKVVVRIGRRVLIDLEEFFKWLQAHNPKWAKAETNKM